MCRGCINCGRGFHEQCRRCRKGKCHTREAALIEEVESRPIHKSPIRHTKDSDFKDPHSTGRKRAAKLYPLDIRADCEWKGLKNCGGGRFPVIGCWRGKQSHRHHGPVKNTLVNHEGNVHRICHDCHIRWHELNDVGYVEGDYNLLPHQPQPATDLEGIQYELDWKSGEIAKKFTLKSSKEGLKFRKTMGDD